MKKQEVEEWEAALHDLQGRISERFKRVEPWERAYRYIQGLLSNIPRKNGWQLAEAAGEQRPDGMQRLMSTAVWDEDGVRDDLHSYIVEHIGEADGVLVVDETGILKKGQHSVGVKRQYSGAAGGVENCQIGVFLSYSTRQGHALLDRALYLPKDWIDDPARRQRAQIPPQVSFAKKADLARALLQRAFTAQVPHQWITADTVYGDDLHLRQWLQSQRQWYVLGITRNHLLYYDGARQRFDEIAASLPPSAWQQLSCGMGTKGERLYEWAMVSWRNADYLPDELHAFVVRRNLTDPTDEAYFRIFAPCGTSLQTLAQVAGRRWTVEECFEVAKNELGLDHYELRSWRGWHRHITLVMLAFAFLVVTRSLTRQQDLLKKTLRQLTCHLLPSRCLKFATYLPRSAAVPHLPFPALWLGPAGDAFIRPVPNSLIFTVSSVFCIL